MKTATKPNHRKPRARRVVADPPILRDADDPTTAYLPVETGVARDFANVAENITQPIAEPPPATKFTRHALALRAAFDYLHLHFDALAELVHHVEPESPSTSDGARRLLDLGAAMDSLAMHVTDCHERFTDRAYGQATADRMSRAGNQLFQPVRDLAAVLAVRDAATRRGGIG